MKTFIDFDSDEDKTVCCKYCGEEELRWKREDCNWVLLDESNNIHDCLGTKTMDIEEI